MPPTQSQRFPFLRLNRRAARASILLAGFTCPAMALPGDPFDHSNQLFKTRQAAPIQVEKKVQPLEELIVQADLPFRFPQPVPLQGLKISGLNTKSIQSLGENYFVVVANTKATRMSDLYKQNRIDGKANYITSDCVIHPYLAFSNRVYAEVVRKHLAPLTRTLLISLLQVAVADHSQTDDPDVKADIEANVAFLTVALKLIDPNFGVVQLGRVQELVDLEIKNIQAGKRTRSVILEKDEDFNLYKPLGWYASAPDLTGFYRARVWLSRLAYPINDVDFTSGTARANNFRRSVLLYRCLDLAEVHNKPAYESWVRLVKCMFLLGTQIEHWQEKNLYPQDYKAVFKTNSADLKVTLNQLAEPLYRTKLLLAVRKQKPVSLSSTSIWDIDDAGVQGPTRAAFRLMPQVGMAEEQWLRNLSPSYPAAGSQLLVPAALIDLCAWGATPAGNILLYSSWALDVPVVSKSYQELKKWVARRLAGGQVQPVESRVWTMVSPMLTMMPDGIQTVLRSEMWTNRRMESAFCAFLDSQFTIGPPMTPVHQPKPAAAHPHISAGSSPHAAASHSSKTPSPVPVPQGAAPSTAAVKSHTPAQNPSTGVSAQTQAKQIAETAAQPQTAKRKKAARGHYVDPCPEVFARLAADAARLDKELADLGFNNPTFKQGFAEFTRLFSRLERIASDEVNGKPLSAADLSLLANFDSVLDKIDTPLPAVLSIAPGKPISPTQDNTQKLVAPIRPETASPTGSKPALTARQTPAPVSASGTATSDQSQNLPDQGGFNMALGRPGHLYIILQNKGSQEWTLARGAVYTYYEVPGAPVSAQELLSRLDSGKLAPQYWTERFDMVQTPDAGKRQVATH